MAWSPDQRLLPEPCPHCGSDMPEKFHSSCRQRAAWTEAEREEFDRDDAHDEALEHSLALFRGVGDSDELEAERPRKHLRAPNKGYVERVRARLEAKGITVRKAA